jgi:transcriptional regulator with PAS, ATPase and Fis domain
MESSAMFESASSLFQEVLTKAKKIASSEKSILLRGETGTGKELMAKFIHDNSQHKDKPYKTVNIAAYNDNFV